MITVEANKDEMPAVPEDLHDMMEEGVELMHGLACTAMLGNGKVDALQLHPAKFSGAIWKYGDTAFTCPPIAGWQIVQHLR